MNIVFCSMMFDNVEKDIRNSKEPNSVSGHKFQQNLLEGFLANECNVYVINTPRIRRFPDYKSIFIKKKEYTYNNTVVGHSVGFINLFGINHVTQFFAVRAGLRKYLRDNPGCDCVFVTFNTYPAPAKAILSVSKSSKRVLTLDVIGDIYGQFGLSSGNTFKGRCVDQIHNMMEKMARQFDVYAFLTEYMAGALGVSKKPYVVTEGMYIAEKETNNNKALANGEIIVFYAGNLAKEYGIVHLINAFLLINRDNYHLYVAGIGLDTEYVKEMTRSNENIHYLGYITPDEVNQWQKKATVLVNPRTSNYKFVKYSFASKNLECLASGKPYIAHKLPCNPPEYDGYILYPDDESDKALSDKIIEICELSEDEREQIGKTCRDFVVNEKSPHKQCRAIINMLKKEIKKKYER